MEVINALVRNTIDLKRAGLILRALHIAVKNAHRVKIDLDTNNMVDEVPEYPAQPSDHSDAAAEAQTEPRKTEMDLPYAAAVSPQNDLSFHQRQRLYKAQQEAERQAQIRANLLRASNELAQSKLAANAPANAPVRPADNPSADGSQPALRERSQSKGPGGPGVSGRGALPAAPHAATRKPPISVKQTEAPQERNSKARRAGGG